MNPICNSLLSKPLGGGVRLSHNTLNFRLNLYSTSKWKRNVCNLAYLQRQVAVFTLFYYWNYTPAETADLLLISLRTYYRDRERALFQASRNIGFCKMVCSLRDYLLYNADVIMR